MRPKDYICTSLVSRDPRNIWCLSSIARLAYLQRQPTADRRPWRCHNPTSSIGSTAVVSAQNAILPRRLLEGRLWASQGRWEGDRGRHEGGRVRSPSSPRGPIDNCQQQPLSPRPELPPPPPPPTDPVPTHGSADTGTARLGQSGPRAVPLLPRGRTRGALRRRKSTADCDCGGGTAQEGCVCLW